MSLYFPASHAEHDVPSAPVYPKLHEHAVTAVFASKVSYVSELPGQAKHSSMFSFGA